MEPGGHEFQRVEEDEQGFVLICRCGWRSARHGTAEGVGNEWDRHRSAGGISDGRFGD